MLGNDFDAASVAIRAAVSAAEASEVDRVRVRVAQRGQFVLAELAHYRPPAGSVSARDESPSADDLRSELDHCVARSPSAEVAAYADTGKAEYSRGRGTSDSRLWQQAAQSWAKLDRPRGVAYCTFRWAEAELLAGRPTAAADQLRRAYELASQLGAEPIRHAAEELAQRGRIQLHPAQTPRTRRRDAWGLTNRERDVLRELTHGLSNREIGDKLLVSHRTVAMHISNLLAKLSVQGRTEAAALAMRLHLLDDEGETT
jgi:DNA-binding CsgD family transcriptional regulator